jgi:hypothetical protein
MAVPPIGQSRRRIALIASVLATSAIMQAR